ncbi:MAG: hypothetical protein JO115_18025 [Pseudonocardiales bacterium]|nr:hypothetical protein [Pseudonocardiales bacterium]
MAELSNAAGLVVLVCYRPGAGCLLNQVPSTSAAPSAGSPVRAGQWCATTYQGWGWPVTQHRKQVRLHLDRDVSALEIPIMLCAAVTQLRTARRCVPPVLIYPYMPEHHILLTGQRYGVLPWPDDVHQIVGALLLPPSVTPRGPVSWLHSPRQESLQLCREVDAYAAFRTIPKTPTGGSRG